MGSSKDCTLSEFEYFSCRFWPAIRYVSGIYKLSFLYGIFLPGDDFLTNVPIEPGLQCFEGLKAYKSLKDDSLLMFRTDKNVQRLKASMDRLHMGGTDFDDQELIRCIAKLVSIDRDWIPKGEGYSMYLRPTVVSTHGELGVLPPKSLLLYVITSPVGPYYKTGFKPIRLATDTPYVRAWQGGTGNAKVGGNYGPTLKAAHEAAKQGYSQVLWIIGEDEQITEVGAMNVFFYLVNKENWSTRVGDSTIVARGYSSRSHES